MTNTTIEVPILLLHSSCAGENEASDPYEWKTTTNDNNENNAIEENLLNEQIFCDLLFLPEMGDAEMHSSENLLHSSSSPSQHQEYLHLAMNQMNPCGISNILSLENFPRRWLSGRVLLSLTSCSILSNRTSYFLPVEPNPSTFVLDFYHDQDMERFNDKEGDENQLHDSSIATTNDITEIFVEFDVLEASRHVNELFGQENTEMVDQVGEDNILLQSLAQADEIPDENRTIKYDTSFMQVDDIKGKGEDSSHHDRHSRFEYISCNLNFDECFANKDLQQQKLMLAHLYGQMEQGSRMMDLVMVTCAYFCIFLIALLLWAIYQYYTSTFKSDLFSQELRESMKATRDTLQKAVDELKKYDRLSPHRKKLDSTIMARRDDERDLGQIGVEEGRIGTNCGSRMRPSKSNNRSTLKQIKSFTNAKTEGKDSGLVKTASSIGTNIDYQDVCSQSHRANGGEDNCVIAETQDNEEGNLNHPVAQDTKKTAARRAPRNQNDIRSLTGRDKEGKDKNANSVITMQDTRHLDISQKGMPSNEGRVKAKTYEGRQKEVGNFPGKTPYPVQLPEIPPLPRENKKKLIFLKSPSHRRRDSPLFSRTSTTNESSSPSSKLVEKCRDRKPIGSPFLSYSGSTNEEISAETLVNFEKKATSTPLSPCSQLVKEWNEGKPINLDSLEKRRQHFKPFVKSNAEPSLSSSKETKCSDDTCKNLFGSTVFSRVPEKNNPNRKYKQSLACSITAPPNALVGGTTVASSLVNDEVTKDITATHLEEERKVMDGMKTPPQNMVMQKTPHLCYTPASEDDSFVDDYW